MRRRGDRSRIIRPGAQQGRFLPHQQPRGAMPGSMGQQVHLAHPFAYVWSRQDIVDEIELRSGSSASFAWWAGLGNSPFRGPSLSVTGTPGAGTTPWQDRAENEVASELYDGTEYRDTATAVDPGALDVRALLLCRIPHDLAAGHVLLGTRVAGRGWAIVAATTTTVRLEVEGNALANTGAMTVTPGGWALLDAYIDRDGNAVLYLNGTAGATVACPAGSIDSAAGIGLWARPGGGSVAGSGGVVSATVLYADGFTPATSAPRAAHQMLGTWATQGDQGSFTRASAASWQDRRGVWHIATPGLPRAGDKKAGGESGLRAAPARTNEAYRNINPADVSALTWTGATAPTVVDDSTALAAVAEDASAWGPNVYEFANGTGSTQYVRMSAQTGDVNARSLQVLARHTVSTGVKLGLYDESAGTFVGTAIHDGYDARTIIDGQVPGDTDSTLALEVPDGVTVRWIAQDMQTGVVTTTPIPNFATAATAARPNEVLTTSYALRDGQGSIECGFTPAGWNASSATASARVLKGSALFCPYILNGDFNFFDSTSSAGTIAVSGDGIRDEARTRWAESGKSLTVNGARADSAYDGTLLGSGAGPVTIEPSSVEFAIDTLAIYKNGSG